MPDSVSYRIALCQVSQRLRRGVGQCLRRWGCRCVQEANKGRHHAPKCCSVLLLFQAQVSDVHSCLGLCLRVPCQQPLMKIFHNVFIYHFGGVRIGFDAWGLEKTGVPSG